MQANEDMRLPFFSLFLPFSYQKLALTSDEVFGYHELGLPPW
jgi:hypothetical protein